MKIRNGNFIVWGLGISGMSALKLLKELGNSVTCVNSGAVSSWSNYELIKEYSDEMISEEEFCPSCLGQRDGLIISPGVAGETALIQEFQKLCIPIMGEIELAYQVIKQLKTPIIAITGTNGKTTTATLVDEILKNSGYKAFLGGNIGIPFAEYALKYLIENTIASVIVLELSSFQLETLIDFRADSAAILNISPNHGERYEKHANYIDAKLMIMDNMVGADTLIIRNDERDYIIGPKGFNILEIDKNDLINLKDYNLAKYSLFGCHNLSNLSFAIELIKALGLNLKGVQKTIDSFRGVSHRLELVKKCHDYYIFNDAKSTNWDASMSAINSLKIDLPNADLRLIIGGKLRGNNNELCPYKDEIFKACKFVFLFGESGKKLAREFTRSKKRNFLLFETITDIIIYEKKKYSKGILLFSPAFPSFDQYTNYKERGEHFIKLIKDLES